MTRFLLHIVAGALGALLLGSAAQAACPHTAVTSIKGSISGTFYAADGTVTKVKCPLTLERVGGPASFKWGNECPGLAAYGSGVYLRAGEALRIAKSAVPQKSCAISNQYALDAQRMYFVTSGVASTVDTLDPAVLTKEKGTVVFTRQEGVFSGRYSVTFPVP